MRGCLLKVNRLDIHSIRIRREPEGGVTLLLTDQTFGEFPLSPACLIEYLDLGEPKATREWRRITYDELVPILQEIKAQARG